MNSTLSARRALVFAFAALSLLLLPASALTQSGGNDLTAQVDKIFAQFDKPNSPGCALAVIKDSQIIYKRGYGMADLDHDHPDQAGHAFHVASVSKQFTAFAILLLAQQGKLSLDDNVQKAHHRAARIRIANHDPASVASHQRAARSVESPDHGRLAVGRRRGERRRCSRSGLADERAQLQPRRSASVQQHRLYAAGANRQKSRAANRCANLPTRTSSNRWV